MDEARACLAEGEVLLRGVGERLELGALLCKRSRYEQHAGDLEAARATLAEAESLAEAVSAGADSELGRAIASARAELAGGAQ